MIKRLLLASVLVLFFSSLTPLFPAQTRVMRGQQRTIHGDMITVSRAGTAFAKPDLAILTMAIQSSEPLVGEATTDNVQKAKAVESALAGLGFSHDQYKVTSVAFGRDGANGAGGVQYVQPNQPPPMGYSVSQYVYVFFDGPELNDVAQLGEKVAGAIEALRKAGATPTSPSLGPGRFYPPQSQAAMVVYTIKDSDKYEREALQQALQRAKEAAQDVATTMQVQLVKLDSVRTGFLSRAYPMRNGLTPLEGLPYRFYSDRSDEVQISANATLNYIFK
jgi:uncharacterized protein YggE